MSLFPEVNLSQSAAEAIARGLFAVAKVDGMHEREAALVASFWNDVGGGVSALSELERAQKITGQELATHLSSADERALFIKTALLLAWADGKVTDAERKQITDYSGALGLDAAQLSTLEDGVKDFLLGHLSHVQNTDATREVAKKLKL